MIPSDLTDAQIETPAVQRVRDIATILGMDTFHNRKWQLKFWDSKQLDILLGDFESETLTQLQIDVNLKMLRDGMPGRLLSLLPDSQEHVVTQTESWNDTVRHSYEQLSVTYRVLFYVFLKCTFTSS